jgi:hypothetical protein
MEAPPSPFRSLASDDTTSRIDGQSMAHIAYKQYVAFKIN